MLETIFYHVTKGISVISQLIHGSHAVYNYLCFALLSYYFISKYNIWVNNML
jgi:hypothetical protein